jgi:hypothetical protein
MNEQDLDQIRAAMRDALAPIEARLASLEVKIDALPDVRLLQEMAHRQQRDAMSFRDDMRVLTAIAMRLDTSHSVLLDELRATHTQIAA